jgi:hypothetical protein
MLKPPVILNGILAGSVVCYIKMLLVESHYWNASRIYAVINKPIYNREINLEKGNNTFPSRTAHKDRLG